MSPTGEIQPGLSLEPHWDLEIWERHSVLVRGAHWCETGVLTFESFDTYYVLFLYDGDAFLCGSFTFPIPYPELSQLPRAALGAGLLTLSTCAVEVSPSSHGSDAWRSSTALLCPSQCPPVQLSCPCRHRAHHGLLRLPVLGLRPRHCAPATRPEPGGNAAHSEDDRGGE